MIVAIHQPNYLPWLGFFHKLLLADIFIVLDDAQFSKGSYTNRTGILRDDKSAWLTQPVRHKFGQAINQVQFADQGWPVKHLDTLRGGYQKAAQFEAIWPELNTIMQQAPVSDLASANRFLVAAIAQRMEIATSIIVSSDISVDNRVGDDRLLALVSAVAPGGTYLSGRGGAKYQDPDKFASAGIGLEYADFLHPRYNQGGGEFVAGLSVVDSLFALGWSGAGALLANS